MKLLIVDDDPLVGQSLQLLLNKESDLAVVGSVSNGQEAIDFCEREVPDLILMDIQMPVLNGIETTKMIKKKHPLVQIMMLTTFQDKRNIRLALKAGAEGYLIKSHSIEQMAEQIRALKSGATVLTPDVLQTLMDQGNSGLEDLTDREKEIAILVGEGLSNKEIAKQLYLGEGTVRNAISIILEKLEIRDRTQLAIYYWKSQDDHID